MSETTQSRRNTLADLAVFTTFIIAAVILLIENILPVAKVNVSESVSKTLNIIQQVAILAGVALGARKFAKNTRNIIFRLAYFLAILVYLIAIILAIFK